IFMVAGGVGGTPGFSSDSFHNKSHKKVVSGIQESPGNRFDDPWAPAGISIEFFHNLLDGGNRSRALLGSRARQLHSRLTERYRKKCSRHATQFPNVLAHKPDHLPLMLTNVHRGGKNHRTVLVEPDF